MDSHQFGYWGKRMVDYICEYQRTLPERKVIPEVQPGYLRPLLPEEAPEEGETWQQIFEDLEKYIVPGLTHWQHPSFHAYFPAANSVPSVMADMFSAALGCIGFSWAASPAMTELEVVMMDWMARLLHLPKEFTHASGEGGGVIQTSASDCILVSMLAARHYAIQRHKHVFEEKEDHDPKKAVLSRLVAYGSNLAHSCVEKASMICMVKFRQLEVDENYSLHGDVLQTALEEDIKNDLIPFFVCATLGTTACCSADDLSSLGPVCDNFNVWLHLDGAYGGNALILPECKQYLKGIEHVWSMNVNPNKWMLVGFDCSLMWVRDHQLLTNSMVVNPIYLQHKHSSKTVDFRHWGIPLSRRFRALKLWFVLRIYGASGIREYIRRHIRLAQSFTELVKSDDRFELVGKPIFGLVCFRLKGSNTLNQYLTRAINESLEVHVVPAVVNDIYFIRFAVCRETCTPADIHHAWEVISLIAGEILRAQDALDQWRHYILRKTGTFPVKAGLDELSTSAISDEEGEADGQHWDKLLIRGQADENLVRVIKQRLLELEELGATDAYNLLLSYLQNSGWELDDLQPVIPIHETDEMKALNRSGTSVSTFDSPESDGQMHPAKPMCSSHLTDTEDSGKYSISHGEPSSESGSAEQTSNEDSKSPTRDEVTESTLRIASPSFRIEQFHPQFPRRSLSHYADLNEPDIETNLPQEPLTEEAPSADIVLTNGKTSSPLVEKTLTYQCYTAPTTRNQQGVNSKNANQILKSHNSKDGGGLVPQQISDSPPSTVPNALDRGTSTACQSDESESNGAGKKQAATRNNMSNRAILSKSFDHTPCCSFMPRPSGLPHPIRHRGTFVCERDLAVGSVHNRTLDRVNRTVLRKMISEPTQSIQGRSTGPGEDGIRNRGSHPQIHSFLDEIVDPTNLGLNRSIVPKLGSVQLCLKSEIRNEHEEARPIRSNSDKG